jgi:hypothetical protein
MLCSLVGDPKTATTLVSQWIFLKFIPVMSNIQQMDVPPNLCGSGLAREGDPSIGSDGD